VFNSLLNWPLNEATKIAKTKMLKVNIFDGGLNVKLIQGLRAIDCKDEQLKAKEKERKAFISKINKI
jgi:hypothetical protein